MSTFGSATIASRILRPRASATGGPPQSTGFDTRRYAGMRPSCSVCCVALVRSGGAGRRPRACRPCARRCRPRSRRRTRPARPAACAHAGGPLVGRVRASAAETSSSSSSPSTRVTPNWRNTAVVTASEPVRWPVWHCAIDAPVVGAADLHHHDRLAQLGRVVGGEHQRAPVLEALDVAGDHADLGLVGEVAAEVGELEVDLVAGRRPVREPDAELLALEHRPALVARLGDRARSTGPSRSSRKSSNALRFVLGPSRRTSPAATSFVEPALELLALLAGLGEAGREDHRELGLALRAPPRTCRRPGR